MWRNKKKWKFDSECQVEDEFTRNIREKFVVVDDGLYEKGISSQLKCATVTHDLNSPIRWSYIHFCEVQVLFSLQENKTIQYEDHFTF